MHFIDKLIENHKILPESLPQLKMTNENTLNLVEVEFVYIICIGDLKITPKKTVPHSILDQ